MFGKNHKQSTLDLISIANTGNQYCKNREVKASTRKLIGDANRKTPVELVCPNCEKQFNVKPSRVFDKNGNRKAKVICCSIECKADYIIKQMSPEWGEGIVPLYETLRRCRQYKKCRKEILNRDECKCQECGIQNDHMHIHHHLKSFKAIIRDNKITTLEQAKNCQELWDINNGITLCEKCHTDKHINKDKNRKEQQRTFTELIRYDCNMMYPYTILFGRKQKSRQN